MTASDADAERVADYDYELPPERIAQHPLPDRDGSKLLLVKGSRLSDHRFTEVAGLLEPGDLLVANDTRVRAARLRGVRQGGGRAELLVLAEVDADGNRFACLVRPARRLPEGSVVEVGEGLRARIDGPTPGHAGARLVTFEALGDVAEAIESAGMAPLPPYIHERLRPPDRYQTVYAEGSPRSAAAPTAGLHITHSVLSALEERGIGWATVRLEIGLGTFAPMTSLRVDDHAMHEERFSVPEATVHAIAATRRRGGRVVAVGTTSVRALETAAGADGSIMAGDGVSRLFIRPGHRFRVIDGVITNFHQPRSSLLVLIASLIGPPWRAAYAHALDEGYRFLSFGDCMLAWRSDQLSE